MRMRKSKKIVLSLLALLFFAGCPPTSPSPTSPSPEEAAPSTPRKIGPILKSFFVELDKNTDGSIDKNEIVEFFRENSGFFDWGVFWHGPVASGVMEQFDLDRSGGISRGEAERAIASSVIHQSGVSFPIDEAGTKAIFDAIDSDSDGFLSRQEVEAYAKRMLTEHVKKGAIAFNVVARCVRRLLFARINGAYLPVEAVSREHFALLVRDLNSFVAGEGR